jgi:broad specificity phosphatase PhoE
MKSILFIAMVVVLASCSSAHYCYIVRHAEKLDNTPYSVLSPAGHQRAVLLKDSLLHKKIDIIFATTFKRTQETAQPLATALNKEMSIYRNNAVDSIAAVVKGLSKKNILMVGHSGNIPGIVEAITGQKVNPIAEPEYDNMYIIRSWKGKRTLTQTKYGG